LHDVSSVLLEDLHGHDLHSLLVHLLQVVDIGHNVLEGLHGLEVLLLLSVLLAPHVLVLEVLLSLGILLLLLRSVLLKIASLARVLGWLALRHGLWGSVLGLGVLGLVAGLLTSLVRLLVLFIVLAWRHIG
jgi:hypothetical protein